MKINLRTHPQYYRNGVEDQETWSWTPWIDTVRLVSFDCRDNTQTDSLYSSRFS